jgi:asparagine synthase (glutamine-hydrolysing)
LQHILYRQKEQFSDGVGYSWIDGLKSHAASNVTIAMSITICTYIYKDNSIS